MNNDIDNMNNIEPEGEHVFARLSAYIDNDLTDAAYEQVRRHIETCPDCRADYVELRATQQLLQSLPVVPPPRAFTLTEEDVANVAGARVGWFHRLFSPRNSPRFAMGSALSFVLLLFMLTGNVLQGSRVNQTFSRIGSGLDGGMDAFSSSSQAPMQAYDAPMLQPTPAPEDSAKMFPPAAEATSTAAALNVISSEAPAAQAPSEVTPQAGQPMAGAVAPTQVVAPPDVAVGGGEASGAATPMVGAQAYTNFQGSEFKYQIPGTTVPITWAHGGWLDVMASQTPPGDVSRLDAMPESVANREGGISGVLLFESALAGLGILLAVGAMLARRRA